MTTAKTKNIPQHGHTVSELNNYHLGEDIYVIGTGASMRVFPPSFFENRVTIGLNRAWEIVPVKYCLTTRPELNIPEFLELPVSQAYKSITWITKYTKFTEDGQRLFATENKERFYYFDSIPEQRDKNDPYPGRILDWVEQPTEDLLYLYSSVSQTAANLAANMGAKNVILVGCDNCALNENHHAHDQHTMWKEASPEYRYQQYYDGLVEVRASLRKRGVNLLSLTPFMALNKAGKDFSLLCKELEKPEFIDNKDITHEMTDLKKNWQLGRIKSTLNKLFASKLVD